MSAAEIQNITLLYEFDNRSPLFARIAFEKMNEKNYSEAEGILTTGLKDFPNYPTAYFLLAEVKLKLGKSREEKELIKKANILLGDRQTEKYYEEKFSEIENKQKEFVNPHETGIDFSGDFNEEKLTEQTEEESELPIEERLDELAQQLENARITVNESPDEDKEDLLSVEGEETQKKESVGFDDINLTSETLGMILESQGKFEEAIKVYRKLIELEPDKKEIYELKIQELSEHLSEENE